MAINLDESSGVLFKGTASSKRLSKTSHRRY